MRVQGLVALTCVLTSVLASAATVDDYAELVGKTVLAPSSLPSIPDSIDSGLTVDKPNAVAWLEKEFSKKGISVVQDGPCFVRLVPNQAQADLSFMELRGAQLHTSSNQQMIAAGAVNFPGTDLSQVLELYAQLKGRTILRTRFLPAPTIRFKNQCPLTREELVYALETVLVLNGLSTVDDGRAFVQIVPIQLRSGVDAHAPSADPDAKLFDPKKVPSIGYTQPQPKTKLERDLERWQQAFFNFMQINRTRNSSAQHLLMLYASLTDKKAEPSKEYESSPIWFHVSTPLTKNELLYAIQTTFALNNLEIRAGEQDRVRLGPKMGPGKAVSTIGKSIEPKIQ